MLPGGVPPRPRPTTDGSLRVLQLANWLILLLSIALLVVGIWLTQRPYDRCSSRLHWLVISIAIILLLVSLLGIVGAAMRSPALIWLYIALLTIALIMLIVFTVFAFVLKNEGYGGAAAAIIISGNGDAKLASTLTMHDTTPTTTMSMSPTKMATNTEGLMHEHAQDVAYVAPGSGSNEYLSILKKYECEARFLARFKKDWATVATTSIVVLIMLILLYLVACAAFVRALAAQVFHAGYAY